MTVAAAAIVVAVAIIVSIGGNVAAIVAAVNGICFNPRRTSGNRTLFFFADNDIAGFNVPPRMCVYVCVRLSPAWLVPRLKREKTRDC